MNYPFEQYITSKDGVLERIMIGSGFMQDSAYYVQVKDYQGNVRAVLDQNHNVVERNDYYPYGGLINASDTQLQPYKYSSKELDRENGLDLYDSQARWYDSMLPGTTTQDPLAEKYYSISPYTWCAGNPVRFIDLRGDSLALLYYDGQHSAMLIQANHSYGKRWHYYSFNGTGFFNSTSGSYGGSCYNNLGKHNYGSVEEFLRSDYNTEGNEQSIRSGNSNGYGYTKALIIPTTDKQDEAARKAFVKVVNKGYNLFKNNCLTAALCALKAVGINVQSKKEVFDSTRGVIIEIIEEPSLPSTLYNNIKTLNSGLKEIEK